MFETEIASRLEELTEWCRNKPEKAAQRILELEGRGRFKETPLAAPATTPIGVGYPGWITTKKCLVCNTEHSPHGPCPYSLTVCNDTSH